MTSPSPSFVIYAEFKQKSSERQRRESNMPWSAATTPLPLRHEEIFELQTVVAEEEE